MVNLFFLTFILVPVALSAYLLRFRLRRWWRAEVVKRNLPPHERWPEVLHWQKGDEFDFCGSIAISQTSGRLLSITEDGYVYLQERLGDKFCLPVRLMVGRNQSLRNRNIDAALKRDNEYMELLRQFNVAYAELRERDKKLKLVS